jgi:hypothetical protein
LKFQAVILDIMLKETKKGRVKDDGSILSCSDIEMRLKEAVILCHIARNMT